jgi:sulfonate transport system substrate-binding protein
MEYQRDETRKEAGMSHDETDTQQSKRLVTRTARLAGLAVSLLLSVLVHGASAEDQTLHIGVQKYGTLIVLEAGGALDQRLKPLGINVAWTEFTAGPPLLEAMNGGSIDFGITGESPPVFAQSAGIPFVYVAFEPSAPEGEAILVPKDSPIHSIADLKAKRVAFNKGSNVHFFLVEALAHAGLSIGDIDPAYLAPADARAAFERGSVDAWVIWDPYLAAGQSATKARVLSYGTGLVKNYQFYLAAKTFVAAHPDVLRVVLEEIGETDAWAAVHQADVAQLLAPKTGLPVDVLTTSLARLTYGVAPLDPTVVANQQLVADTFSKLGIIPKAVSVKDAVWPVE